MVGPAAYTAINKLGRENMHIKGKIVGPIGVLILIMGGLTAISGFSAVSDIDDFQYVEISNGTLIVDDLDGGFTVYVDYPPVDLNNNQIHDVCENIVITATHDGKWISDYYSEYPEVQNPDPQREVFSYSVGSDNSNRGCSTIYGAEAAWYEDRELTQIGTVCVGCMKGNTTIVAEDNVSMWIKTNGIASDAWAGVVGGLIMGCCGACFIVFGIAGGVTITNGNNNPQVNSYQPGYQMTKPNYDAIPQPVYQQTIESYQEEISPAVTTTGLTKPSYDQTSDVQIEKEKSEPEPTKGNFWDNA